jgi:protein TonB
MKMRAFGIGLAILFHLGVILFGGLLFPGGSGERKAEIREVDLLDETASKPEKEERKEPEAEKTESREESEEQIETPDPMPDLRELARLEAGPATPALDAVSLSALEDLLHPGAAAGESGLFARSADLTSGGRIGGAGKPGVEESTDPLYNLTELDQKPQVIFQAPPSYPTDLRERKVEGSVYVLFVVDEEGRVVSPRVEKSSDPKFERPALEAVGQWKFEPAIREGKKVKCRMRVPLRFAIG